jgi:hypothetical protein
MTTLELDDDDASLLTTVVAAARSKTLLDLCQDQLDTLKDLISVLSEEQPKVKAVK